MPSPTDVERESMTEMEASGNSSQAVRAEAQVPLSSLEMRIPTTSWPASTNGLKASQNSPAEGWEVVGS